MQPEEFLVRVAHVRDEIAIVARTVYEQPRWYLWVQACLDGRHNFRYEIQVDHGLRERPQRIHIQPKVPQKYDYLLAMRALCKKQQNIQRPDEMVLESVRINQKVLGTIKVEI